MLTDIYARSMLNATRHSDLPLGPLSTPKLKPSPKTAKLRQKSWRKLLQIVTKRSSSSGAAAPRQNCMS